MLDEPGKFSPETQRERSLTLDSTCNTLSLVCDNIRALRDVRARGERRIKELTEELERTRLKAQQAESQDAQAASRWESLQRQLDRKTSQRGQEETEHKRVALDLSSARKEIDTLRSQLNAVSAERDVLVERKDDCDGIRGDKLVLERQRAETAAFVTAQEQAIAGFEEGMLNPLATVVVPQAGSRSWVNPVIHERDQRCSQRTGSNGSSRSSH